MWYRGTLSCRCLPIAGAVILLGLISIAADQAPTAAGPEQKQLTPTEKEQLRIAQIVEWAAKSGASQELVFKKIFEPVIEGNAKDQDRNRRLAEECGQASSDAKKNGDTKAAEKYHSLDLLFAECSRENARVVTSYRAGNVPDFRAALTRLKQLDRRIEEISGKDLERSWLVMDEMVASMGAPATAPAVGRAQPAAKPKQK